MMEYNEVWCLFCTTGKESSVAERIHEKGWGRAIFPQRVKTIRRNREWTETHSLAVDKVRLYCQAMCLCTCSREKRTGWSWKNS